MHRDEIQVTLIFIILFTAMIFISFKAQKERDANRKKLNEYEKAKNEYLIKTYKDEKTNKTYRIILDKIGDVIFCEEIPQQEVSE